MKRVKKHNLKKEKHDASTSQFRDQEEHDLAYYIHDRVELVHQVFSVLKYKDFKAMAPECVRHISIDDLQELCTEELLGISSKRLCSILDGAEPPSDTESSSCSPSPLLETISLDSISSDEEILSQASKKKKKHKHRHRDSSHSKSKAKKKKSRESPSEDVEQSKASRAGLTVLELLELQARARAIRAQLQQEQAAKQPPDTVPPDSSLHSSDNEVEIKEEPADVVEISSEDEKPKIEELQLEKSKSHMEQASPTMQPNPVKLSTTQPEATAAVHKKIKDLVITVPQVKPTRKIKLKRNNVTVSVPNVVEKSGDVASVENSRIAAAVHSEVGKVGEKNLKSAVDKVKTKSKKRKIEKKEVIEEDHDEITLQLSDSEKMDLLQDLDRKAFENVSSSEDSESSSESESQSDEESSKNKSMNKEKTICTVIKKSLVRDSEITDAKMNSDDAVEIKYVESLKHSSDLDIKNKIIQNEIEGKTSQEIINEKHIQNSSKIEDFPEDLCQDTESSSVLVEKKANTQEKESEKVIDKSINESKSIIIQNTHEKSEDLNYTENLKLHIESEDSSNKDSSNIKGSISKDTTDKIHEVAGNNTENVIQISAVSTVNLLTSDYESNIAKDTNQCEEKLSDIATTKVMESELSEGEVSERSSSVVEACELKPVVVCISDEEASNKKKKKKKDKKSKKEKKSKKSKLDFREGADQNFYRDANNENEKDKSLDGDMVNIETKIKRTIDIEEESINIDDDDVYEILELSDDSSCYEVGGTVLSKEPTTEEILALSAKIDEIEREEVVTDEQIRVHESMLEVTENNVENMSWKDRYLGSKKVKKVLTTSNILNALRKKNKELKKKLEDSKNKAESIPIPIDIPMENLLEEGSIEHYNMLEGSTTFVDPVKEPEHEEVANGASINKSAQTGEESGKTVENNEETGKTDGEAMEKTKEKVMNEMKKDAKQLLKMYKKLLKYNDMNKRKDPNKKKKKKQKKAKNKDVQCCPVGVSTSK